MLFDILQRVVMQLHITHTRSGQALETTLSKHNNCDCRQLVENIERLKRLRGKKEKWKAPCWGRSKQQRERAPLSMQLLCAFCCTSCSSRLVMQRFDLRCLFAGSACFSLRFFLRLAPRFCYHPRCLCLRFGTQGLHKCIISSELLQFARTFLCLR